MTRLEKLEQIEKRKTLPAIKMDLLPSKLWQGQILIRVQDYSYSIAKKNALAGSQFFNKMRHETRDHRT